MSPSTGPVAEVTPWELYPAPRRPRSPSTNTGPVGEVTPWELAPGPDHISPSPPPSPTTNKFSSIYKHEANKSNKSRITSPSNQNFTPLPFDLLDTYGTTMGVASIPPLALQRSLPGSTSKYSISSVTSLPESKHSHRSTFKWPSRPSSRRGSQKDSLPQRTRQVPLTGPLEDVAPWEINPPPQQKSTTPVSRRSNSNQDGPSTTSFSPVTFLVKRARANSVSEAHYCRGQGTVASSASLPLHSGRSSPDVNELDERRRRRVGPPRFPLPRARSLTGQTSTNRSAHRPASSSGTGATSIMSTMNVVDMERILPWELYPIPISVQRSNASDVATEEKDPKTSSRTSTSTVSTTTTGKAFVELALKRRSTGGGTHRVPSASSRDVFHAPSLAASVSGGTTGKGISNVSAPISSSSLLLPISTIPSTSSTSSTNSQPQPHHANNHRTQTGKEKGGGAGPSHDSSPPPPPSNAKFSTADRTILEELKANIRAREAQFSIRGVGHTMLGGRKCPGKKYHPHKKNEVPYPRCYEREVVDLDVWETMFWLDLCKGLSWHSFERPPTRVLEIGCGTGTWILQAARTWKDCHFVGLDIVPLHPNLQNFSSSDLVSRITWVQHNFLDGLPFQHEEFDFVHIKRIALGIPEDKWDKFLEEVQRVMKPGGALEMIEEDLFFPGKPINDNDDVASLDLEATSSTFTTETSNGTTLGLHTMPQIDEQDIVKSFNDDIMMSKQGSTQSSFNPSDMEDNSAPRNPRDHTILEAIWHGMLESRFVNSSPLSLLPTYLEYHFQDVRTHPPLLYSFPPPPDKLATCKAKNYPATNGATTPPTSPLSKPFDTFDANANKHRSLYVALDETRSDALSPSDLASSPKKTKDARNHIAMLPDQCLCFDIRTLNLHLSLRAKEIVACSEPMWEWVQEFQVKERWNGNGNGNNNKRPARFRSGSIEVALLGSARDLNGRDGDVLVRDAILEMTRDDFDQMLNTFQLDMQDKASVKDVLEQRFDWRTFTSEPLQDRKTFDSACQKYDEWVANFNQLDVKRSRAPVNKDSGRSDDDERRSCRIPRQLTSCQQLSRAMRVFVAWKDSA